MSVQKQPSVRTGRWLLLPSLAALLVIAYALAGFLLAPWIAERELPRFIEEQLHHRARIGKIDFNPFTLRLQAREFVLETSAGQPVLGFADAVADLEWHSLLRRAWILDEVRLADPVVHVEIAKDGRLNLAALAPGTAGAESGPLPGFAIGHFSVTNGSVSFEDQRQGYRNRLERLSIELASLSTLDSETGPYALTGETPGGARLQWKGELTLAPLSVAGTLAVGNAPLAELMPYIDDVTAARVLAGRADVHLPYHLALTGGKPRFSLQGAKLDLRGLVLAGVGENKSLLTKFGPIALGGVGFDSDKQHAVAKTLHIGESSLSVAKDVTPIATAGPVALDGIEFSLGSGRGSVQQLAIARVGVGAGDDSKPLALLRQVALDGIAFDARTQHMSAKVLRVPELSLALKRDANGELDLQRLFPARGKVAGAKLAAWQVSIGTVELGKASARYTDATAKTPLALALDGLSGSFGFEATSADAGARVQLDTGKFALEKLEALAASAPQGSTPQPAMKLARLSLDGARYDSGSNVIEAAALRIGGFGVDTALENGRVSLLDLLPAAEKTKDEKPLSARANLVELGEGSVNFSDRDRGIALALEHIALKLSDASTDRAKPLAFDFAADVKSGGRVVLRGRAVPAQGTVEAKIDVRGVALTPAQSVLTQYASVKFTSGELSLSGMLSVGGKNAKFAYSGSAGIANLALEDTSGERLFGWKSLAAESIKATLTPDRIDIDELRLIAPAARFAIAKDGTSNISRAFARTQGAAGGTRPTPAGAAAAQAPGPAAAPDDKADGAKPGAARAAEPDAVPDEKADAAQPGAAGTFAVAIRRVRVDQGALDFSDDSLSPGFVAKIYDLAGTANGLSSNRDARSQFSLEGRIGEFGYAHLSGAVNPFVPRNRSTFRVQMRNIDLTTATPYAMRFAGYRIASGRLGLDLNYRVRNNLIEGDNKIALEQFTLGEHVDSPDALKLPFELAINLLKDPDGRISVEVPIKGNLDDPQFSLAPIIWKAVGNFLGNIVAAPFRALAHLFGGGAGEDLAAITFDAGKAKLLPPEKEKLNRIVAALAQRPEIKLLIPAHYDSGADARAMKRAALNREISRRAGFAVAEDEEPGPVNIEDRATRRVLRTMFAERFSKAELDRLRGEAEAKSLAAGQPAPSMTTRLSNFATGEPQLVDTREFHQTLLRRLRETQTLAPNALPELAEQRALAIEGALSAAGVDAARIARTASEPSADADAKQVSVRLSLAAR